MGAANGRSGCPVDQSGEVVMCKPVCGDKCQQGTLVDQQSPAQVLPTETPRDEVVPTNNGFKVKVQPMCPYNKLPSNRDFLVTIDKRDGQKLGIGLDIEMSKGTTLLVSGVQGGSVLAWNDSHVGSEVKRGDRIVEVNGISGDARQLIEALNASHELSIRLRRPELFTVILRTDGEEARLGLVLKYVPGGATLLVSDVHPGLVKDWNQNSAKYTVEKGDRILRVNDSQGPAADLYERILKPGPMAMTFMKEKPPGTPDLQKV